MPAIATDSMQINLNSKFAVSYINGSHCNAMFNLPPLNVPSQHYLHISIINACIPYSFYNINQSNNILIYIVDGIPNTIHITPGNYNSIQLANYLTNNMDNITCTYNIITNKFTFTKSGEFSFNPTSTCLGFMGIAEYYSYNNAITSTFCVNMQSTQCIHIQSNFTTGNINSSSLYEQNTLCTIPINSQPNSNIVYQNQGSVFSTDLYSNTLNNFFIKLVDQDNGILDLNGLHWTITIQIDMVDFAN